MLATVGTVILTVALLRIAEVFIQGKGERDKAWQEGDEIPDATD